MAMLWFISARKAASEVLPGEPMLTWSSILPVACYAGLRLFPTHLCLRPSFLKWIYNSRVDSRKHREEFWSKSGPWDQGCRRRRHQLPTKGRHLSETAWTLPQSLDFPHPIYIFFFFSCNSLGVGIVGCFAKNWTVSDAKWPALS
jgi:hypothetical protein